MLLLAGRCEREGLTVVCNACSVAVIAGAVGTISGAMVLPVAMASRVARLLSSKFAASAARSVFSFKSLAVPAAASSTALAFVLLASALSAASSSRAVAFWSAARARSRRNSASWLARSALSAAASTATAAYVMPIARAMYAGWPSSQHHPSM